MSEKSYEPFCDAKIHFGMDKTSNEMRKRWDYCDELCNIVDFIECNIAELPRYTDGSTIRVGDMMYERWAQGMRDRNREIWTEDDKD